VELIDRLVEQGAVARRRIALAVVNQSIETGKRPE
jgi:hypothetical protein